MAIWDEYNVGELRRITRRAIKGDEDAQRVLTLINDKSKVEVNRRLRALERGNWDYYAYTSITNFTETMYGTTRLKSTKELDYDWENVMLQIKQAKHFMSLKSSTVAGQREIVERRRATMIEEGIITKSTSLRKVKNFLRWLSQDVGSEIMELYGTSGTNMKMLFVAYDKAKNKGNLARIFTKFLAETKETRFDLETFEKMMRKAGVHVEDYFKNKYSDED